MGYPSDNVDQPSEDPRGEGAVLAEGNRKEIDPSAMTLARPLARDRDDSPAVRALMEQEKATAVLRETTLSLRHKLKGIVPENRDDGEDRNAADEIGSSPLVRSIVGNTNTVYAVTQMLNELIRKVEV